MADLETLAAEVVKTVRESDEYKEYARLLAVIKRDPELYMKLSELREKNFSLQLAEPGNMMDLMDALTSEYENVINNGLIGEFLEAEAALCHTVRDFNLAVTKGLEFD